MQPPRNKFFIFWCGSSSVGKTTLTEQFQPEYRVRRLPSLSLSDDLPKTLGYFTLPVIRTEMSFRKVREQIGNPSWEELESDPSKGMFQQKYGMDLYLSRIQEKLTNDEEGIFLFERCPFDIVGYSKAFGLPQEHLRELEDKAVGITAEVSVKYPTLIAYRKVDPSFPYDRLDGIRPDENIRKLCDEYCDSAMTMMAGHLDHPCNSMKLRIERSFNQGKSEVHRIINRVLM